MTQQEYLQHIDALANTERMLPELWKGEQSVIASHFFHWYKVANALQIGKTTLDLGCGCGMASRIYSIRTKATVYAVDRSDVIEHVRIVYPTAGVEYIAHDFTNKFDFHDKPYGNIVAVDVLEHIKSPYFEQMLECMAKHGNKDTKYIISCPIHPDGIDKCSWHVRGWKSIQELHNDLIRFLPENQIVII